MNPLQIKFQRRTFQGAYEFSAWIGDTLRTVTMFADTRQEAAAMARNFFEVVKK
jgi:hypothetical protein